MIHKFILRSFFKSIPGLALVLLTISAALGQQKSKPVDGIIVKVNNQIVLRSDLESALTQQAAGQNKPITDQDRCDMLRMLLQQKLMVARADVDSIVVEEAQVDNALNQRMAQFAAQAGGEQQLEEQLTQHFGKGIKQYREELRQPLREQLIAEKMQDEITSKLNVTPQDVKKFFNNITKDSLPYVSAEVEIGQIVKLAQVSKTQKDEVRNKLLDIKKRIQAGEDFAKLAAQYSEIRARHKKAASWAFSRRKNWYPNMKPLP